MLKLQDVLLISIISEIFILKEDSSVKSAMFVMYDNQGTAGVTAFMYFRLFRHRPKVTGHSNLRRNTLTCTHRRGISMCAITGSFTWLLSASDMPQKDKVSTNARSKVSLTDF